MAVFWIAAFLGLRFHMKTVEKFNLEKTEQYKLHIDSLKKEVETRNAALNENNRHIIESNQKFEELSNDYNKVAEATVEGINKVHVVVSKIEGLLSHRS